MRHRNARLAAHPLLRQLQEAMYADPRTQQVIAEQSGVPDTAWQHWFAGNRKPRFDTLEALANTLGYRIVLVKDDQNDQWNLQGRSVDGPVQPLVGHVRST